MKQPPTPILNIRGQVCAPTYLNKFFPCWKVTGYEAAGLQLKIQATQVIASPSQTQRSTYLHTYKPAHSLAFIEVIWHYSRQCASKMQNCHRTKSFPSGWGVSQASCSWHHQPTLYKLWAAPQPKVKTVWGQHKPFTKSFMSTPEMIHSAHFRMLLHNMQIIFK